MEGNGRKMKPIDWVTLVSSLLAIIMVVGALIYNYAYQSSDVDKLAINFEKLDSKISENTNALGKIHTECIKFAEKIETNRKVAEKIDSSLKDIRSNIENKYMVINKKVDRFYEILLMKSSEVKKYWESQ